MQTSQNPPPEQSSVSAATSSSPAAISGGSKAEILFSLLRTNPFGQLTVDDLKVLNREETQPFDVFRGRGDLYSFPASAEEAAVRVQENVRLFLKNYVALFIAFFLISLYLYEKPVALITLIASLPASEYLEKFSGRTRLDEYPIILRSLSIVIRCAMGVVLVRSGVLLPFFSSLVVAYIAMMLHGAFRNLSLN